MSERELWLHTQMICQQDAAKSKKWRDDYTREDVEPWWESK